MQAKAGESQGELRSSETWPVTLYVQAGDLEAAIAGLEEAGRLIDSKADRRLGWLVQHNMIDCLCRLGHFGEAEVRLREASKLAIELDHRLDLLRLLWLQGQVAAGQGRRDEAVKLLERVRAEFGATRNDVDTALVSLELAVLYLEEGRSAEVRQTAASLVGIFKSQRIEREAAAALRLFHQSAESETVTIEQLRDLHYCLARSRPRLAREVSSHRV